MPIDLWFVYDFYAVMAETVKPTIYTIWPCMEKNLLTSAK